MNRNERRRLNYAIRRDYPEEPLPVNVAQDPGPPLEVELGEHEAEMEEYSDLLKPEEGQVLDENGELPGDGFYLLEDDDAVAGVTLEEEREHVEEERADDWLNRFRDFVVRSNMPQATTKGLLEILREKLPDLPRDHRVFLGTSNWKPDVHVRPEGEYGFYSLRDFLEKTNWLPPLTNLILEFNRDGIPVFKSSKVQTWILSARISHPHSSKPVVWQYFQEAQNRMSTSCFPV